MNKKGVGPLLVIGIVIGLIYLLFTITSSIKLGNALTKIPTWAWIGIIVLILYLLLRGKK